VLGDVLAETLSGADVLVLGLPRGGIPVAAEVARRLRAPLDVFLVRKLGMPGHEELAMGAIAMGGVRVVNDEVVHALGVPDRVVDAVAATEQVELRRREEAYRGNRPVPRIAGRTVVLVDDGFATGSTMRAAARALRRMRPARLVLAAPVGAPDTCASLRAEADDVVCLVSPEAFRAVGLWYDDFEQTSDDEVRSLLSAAAGTESRSGGTGETGRTDPP
jgi:predicted phosphoribosyltransferase